MKELKFEVLPVGCLVPYKGNPRRNDAAVDKVAESIKAFGFKVPIVIDKDNVIVAGHTRLKAAKKLGLSEVPVIRADDLSEEKIRAFRLADNKTAELAQWDLVALEEELSMLEMPMEPFGFENADVRAEDFGEGFTLPDGDKPSEVTMTFSLHKKQQAIIEAALADVAMEGVETFGNNHVNGNALYAICLEWAEEMGIGE